MSNLLEEVLNTPNGAIGLIIKDNNPVLAFYRHFSDYKNKYHTAYTSHAMNYSSYDNEALNGYLPDAINNPVYKIIEDGLLSVIDTTVDYDDCKDEEEYYAQGEIILTELSEILRSSPGEFFIFGDLKSNFSDFAVIFAKDGEILGSSCGPDISSDDLNIESENELNTFYSQFDGDIVKIVTIVK